MDHIFLTTNIGEWGDVIDKLTLPISKVPAPFNIKGWKGYFLDYDNVGVDRLVKACKEFDRKFLSNLNSDYLVFGMNDINNELLIYSSVSGKFPIYFSNSQNKFSLSTNIVQVVSDLSSRELNLNSVLDYLFTGYLLYLTHETFVEGVFKLPPGHRLRVDSKFRFKIEPISTPNEFLSEPVTRFKKKEEFQEAILTELEKVVGGMIKTLGNTPFIADLSCGLDSTLLAYTIKKLGYADRCKFFSNISKKDTGDTVQKIVEKFAQRHDLDLTIWDETNVIAFNKTDLDWSKDTFFPGTHAQLKELLIEEFRGQKVSIPHVTFHGYGGDELYMSHMIHHDTKKIIKDELDWVVQAKQLGTDKVFTSQSLDALSSNTRFLDSPLYFNPIATTSLEWELFPVYWKYNDWGVLPYNNFNLIKLARGIPLNNDKPTKKYDLWKGRTDIFVAEQFRQKLPFDDHVMQIFDVRKDFLVKILKNSVLGKRGIIDSEKMAQMISIGMGKEYFSGILSVFINVIRLEIFLQGNNFT